ncbi:MAG: alanine--tRNA ligase, partial [Chloroflexota bacterium]
TFFEMLGNFSFGDYFKRDAIHYAYELLTQGYGLPPDRLTFTVYESDDEAYAVWVNEIGVDPRRVARMGPKTNFWQMADTGPCGPTSEIHWDRQPELGVDGIIPSMQAEDDRFLELWNLVFMQYNRTQTPDGDYVDAPLPKPGVDTGLGLERLASVVQGVATNYDTDLFLPIMDAIQEDLRHDNATREKNTVAYRVIADHGRAMTFLLSDGVLPGNEGQSYVLRMVMRRAMRFGKKMGVARPFLGDVARAVVATMSSHYGELVAKQEFIVKAIAQEEERFQQTLDNGLVILDSLIAEAQARGERVIAGRDVFRLWDTYGFPIDLTRDVAQERGFTLDEDGFKTAMEEQRKQSQAVGKFRVGDRADAYRTLGLGETKFLGYEMTNPSANVLAIVHDGQSAERALVGDAIELVLDQTPFYAEAGGQVGDVGDITWPSGHANITDTQRPVPGVIAHVGVVSSGTLRVGDAVKTSVDTARRHDIMRNHTATHLLHKALHEIIGEHATQKGSLVAPDRLRFDFNHLSAVTHTELEQIEARVNELILDNRPVHWFVTTKEEALRSGATALFGEKYGDEVRVV